MNVESLHEYCLSKPGAEETLPFGPETVVYKVDFFGSRVSSLHTVSANLAVSINYL